MKLRWSKLCELATAFTATFVLTSAAVAKLPLPTKEPKAETKSESAEKKTEPDL